MLLVFDRVTKEEVVRRVFLSLHHVVNVVGTVESYGDGWSCRGWGLNGGPVFDFSVATAPSNEPRDGLWYMLSCALVPYAAGL